MIRKVGFSGGIKRFGAKQGENGNYFLKKRMIMDEFDSVGFQGKLWDRSSFNYTRRTGKPAQFGSCAERKRQLEVVDNSFYYNRRSSLRRYRVFHQALNSIFADKGLQEVTNTVPIKKFNSQECAIEDIIDLKQKKKKKNKNILKLTTMNVRTLVVLPPNYKGKSKRPVDKLQFLIKEFHHYKVGIMACQEVRWLKHGIGERDGVTFFHSGDEKIAKEGVAIFIRSDFLINSDYEVDYVSSRIICLKGVFKGVKLAIISIYGPTNYYSFEDKMKFWDSLNETIKKIDRAFKIVLLGDFNAKIGSCVDTVCYQDVRGRYMVDKLNENGELLLSFCHRNNYIIANSFFKKRFYGTWQHYRSKKYSCLDYCVVESKDRKNVKDCGINRKMECWTDHHGVELLMKIKFVKTKKFKQKNEVEKKLDYQQLLQSSELCKKVGVAIDKELNEIDITSCKQLLDILYDVSKEIIPVKKTTRFHKDWFDKNNSEVDDMITLRRQYRKESLMGNKDHRMKWKVKHREISNKIQRDTRRMRNSFWTDVGDNIMDLFEKNESRGYFEAMKRVYGYKPKDKITQLLKLDGTKTNSDVEVRERMAEHFKALLNQKGVASEDIETYLQKIIYEEEETLGKNFEYKEMLQAWNSAKRRKAVGIDKIPSELFNYAESEILMRLVLKLCNKMLKEGFVESILKDVVIVSIFKKGSTFDCGNYRGVALIAHIGKVLERMINNRVYAYVENIKFLPESQCGFRKNRNTIDMMFCSKRIAEYGREKRLEVYKCYIDFTKAYDKVDREVLWKILIKIGVPKNLVELIKSLHVGAKATARMDGIFSEEFLLEVGLKQGSILSPLLFNIYCGAIIRRILEKLEELVKCGIFVRFRLQGSMFDVQQLKRRDALIMKLIELMFADDCELVAESEGDLQRMLDIFDEVSTAFSMAISIKKTEVMVIQPKNSAVIKPVITIQGQILKVVEDFKYLGGTESNDNSMDKEIAIRCQKMVVAYNTLRVSVFECKNINLKTKFSMFRSCVITAGVYGSPVWNTTAAHIQKLESCQFRLLRSMCGWYWRDFQSYEDILMLAEEVGAKIFPIELVIRESRVKYVGHVERMEDSRLPKILLHGEAEHGKRQQGGAEKTYRSVVKTDMKKLGIDHAEWQEMAQDRKKWRNAVTVEGRLFFMRSWWEAKAKAKEARHRKRTETESTGVYRDKGESSDKWRDTLNAGRLFHGITRAMAEGRIDIREHQHMKTDLTKGQYTIQHLTSVRIEVGRDILGGMVTALEKAGDESGMFVTGEVKWKIKSVVGKSVAGGKDMRSKKSKRGSRTGQTETQRRQRPHVEEEDWTGLLGGRDLDN
jgi:hypothetical protein